MGKKINPKIFRLNTTQKHNSCWYASKQEFKQKLQEDVSVRRFIRLKLKDSGLARVLIERARGQITIILKTSKPGVIIGRGGKGLEDLKAEIKKLYFGNQKINIQLNIKEVEKPDLESELIVQQIIQQLEKRIPFRRAMKRAIEQVRRAGGKGIRIKISGRLNGAEIARTECLTDGKLPLTTLRADIDYARGAAHTLFGAIGVKVWIYKGTVFEKDKVKAEKIATPLVKPVVKEEKISKASPVKKTLKKKVTK